MSDRSKSISIHINDEKSQLAAEMASNPLSTKAVSKEDQKQCLKSIWEKYLAKNLNHRFGQYQENSLLNRGRTSTAKM